MEPPDTESRPKNQFLATHVKLLNYVFIGSHQKCDYFPIKNFGRPLKKKIVVWSSHK